MAAISGLVAAFLASYYFVAVLMSFTLLVVAFYAWRINTIASQFMTRFYAEQKNAYQLKTNRKRTAAKLAKNGGICNSDETPEIHNTSSLQSQCPPDHLRLSN